MVTARESLRSRGSWAIGTQLPFYHRRANRRVEGGFGGLTPRLRAGAPAGANRTASVAPNGRRGCRSPRDRQHTQPSPVAGTEQFQDSCIFKDDKTCPPTGTGTPVVTTPATIASLDPGAMASAMGSVSGLTADACDDVAVTCDVAGASGRTVTSKDEKVCTVPVCPTNCGNPRIGSGSQPPICTVLQLDGGKVDITGPAGGIDGDICIADSGKRSITGSEFVTGNIRLSAGATFSKSGSGTVGGVLQNQNLSQQVTDALAAAAAATALPCTQTIGNLSSVQTIVGNGGLNVICVTNVTLSGGKKVFLMGGASDQLVVNVTGRWAVSGGSQIRVAGGLQPNAVLYNIIGTGGQVAFSGGGGGTGCCKWSVGGTTSD